MNWTNPFADNAPPVVPTEGDLAQTLDQRQRMIDLLTKQVLSGRGGLPALGSGLVGGFLAYRQGKDRQALEALRKGLAAAPGVVSGGVPLGGAMSGGWDDAGYGSGA